MVDYYKWRRFCLFTTSYYYFYMFSSTFHPFCFTHTNISRTYITHAYPFFQRCFDLVLRENEVLRESFLQILNPELILLMNHEFANYAIQYIFSNCPSQGLCLLKCLREGMWDVWCVLVCVCVCEREREREMRRRVRGSSDKQIENWDIKIMTNTTL